MQQETQTLLTNEWYAVDRFDSCKHPWHKRPVLCRIRDKEYRVYYWDSNYRVWRDLKTDRHMTGPDHPTHFYLFEKLNESSMENI